MPALPICVMCQHCVRYGTCAGVHNTSLPARCVNVGYAVILVVGMLTTLVLLVSE